MIGDSSSAPPPDSGLVDRNNPWPGLPSFREQDQEFFFGREAETEALRRTVMRESTRLTVLFGRSGLGKSSLLQAGLFPRLRRQQLLPVLVRLVYAGERSLVNQVREAILAAAADANVEAPSFAPAETLWESFHRAGANFWDESNRIVVPALVFDQFEEIFTHGKKDPAGREAFLVELADLVEGRPPAAVKVRLDAGPALAAGFSPERHDYKILLSLRQDFLADLDGLRARMRSLGASRLALLQLDGEAALRAVTQAGGHLIDPEVAEKVVRFVSGAGRGAGAPGSGLENEPPVGAAIGATEVASGSGTAESSAAGEARQDDAGAPVPLKDLEIDPTLLSFLCRELNNRRLQKQEPKITFDLLLGSWKNILANFYESSLSGLGEAVRTFIEDRLLTYSGYRDSVAWDNAVSTPGITAQDLRTLRDRRLLHIEERHGKDWIELTHDVLTQVIGESRELRRQREARLKAEAALRESDERERQAHERESEAHQRERETHKLLERSRKLARVVGALAAAAAGIGALAVFLWSRASTAEHKAERALFDSAATLIEKGQDSQALAYLASIMKSDATGSLAARSRAIDTLLYNAWALPVLVARHESDVTSAVLSPDGERLLTASSDGTARLWRVRDGATLGIMRHAGPVSAAEFSPDGKQVLTASTDGTVTEGAARLWDGWTGAGIGKPMRHGSRTFWATFSPGGDRIVTTSLGGLTLWDARSQEKLAKLPFPSWGTAFSPDGKWLLVPQPDQAVAFLDLRTGSLAAGLPSDSDFVLAAAVSHDGKQALTAEAKGIVRVWDLAARKVVSTLEQSCHSILLVEFSPDDHRALTACTDHAVRIWNLAAPGAPVKTLQHDHVVVGAQFSPDGRWVLTGTRDNVARLWDASSGELVLQPMRHDGPIAAVSFSRDGRLAVTAADDGTAKVWDLRAASAAAEQLPGPVSAAGFSADGRHVDSLLQADRTPCLPDRETTGSGGTPRPSRQVLSTTFLVDGRVVATIADFKRATIEVCTWRNGEPASTPIKYPADQRVLYARVSTDGQRVLALQETAQFVHTVHIWQSRTGKHLGEVPLKNGNSQFSADGSFILVSSPAGVQVWDSRTGKEVAEIAHVTGSFSLDSRLVVTSDTSDDRLRVWEAASGRPLGPSLPQGGALKGAEASRDEKRIVTTSWSGEITLWDLDKDKAACHFFVADLDERARGSAKVADAYFIARISPDGRRVLARSPEGLAQVWDVETCRPLAEPLRQPEWVRNAEFSSDGSRILTVSYASIARVWEMPESSPADSQALADLAEAVGGFKVDESGTAVRVGDSAARLARLRAASGRAGAGAGLASRIIRWFFADPATRTISPFSEIRVPRAPSVAVAPADARKAASGAPSF